jgi:hypothetical protein
MRFENPKNLRNHVLVTGILIMSVVVVAFAFNQSAERLVATFPTDSVLSQQTPLDSLRSRVAQLEEELYGLLPDWQEYRDAMWRLDSLYWATWDRWEEAEDRLEALEKATGLAR